MYDNRIMIPKKGKLNELNLKIILKRPSIVKRNSLFSMLIFDKYYSDHSLLSQNISFMYEIIINVKH